MVYPMVACNRKKKVVLIATLILLSVLNVSLQINTQFTFSGFFLSDELHRNMTNKCLVLNKISINLTVSESSIPTNIKRTKP